MVRNLVIICLSLALFTATVDNSAWAQNDSAGVSKALGPRKQIATIIFAGLAGAILGLSTLSFYGRPQDRLSNIAVGFAVGVIIGATYTTYKAATEPRNMYDIQPPDGVFVPKENLANPEIWQVAQNFNQRTDVALPILGHAWEF